MDKDVMRGTDAVGLFCRLHMNLKKDIPIRPSEMGVLIFTHKQCNQVTPLMISNFFKITKPSVTSIINSLIEKDFLVKTPSPADGRSYLVSATEKGTALVESAFGEYFRTMQLLKMNMGSEQFNLFIDLIQNANSILSEEKK